MERPFAHQYATGALRRVYVRGRGNVAKRVLLQAAAFNLALILRSITKAGTPKGLADLKIKLVRALWRVLAAPATLCAESTPSRYVFADFARQASPARETALQFVKSQPLPKMGVLTRAVRGVRTIDRPGRPF